jgi:hypothetical protein
MHRPERSLDTRALRCARDGESAIFDCHVRCSQHTFFLDTAETCPRNLPVFASLAPVCITCRVASVWRISTRLVREEEYPTLAQTRVTHAYA